MSDGTSIEWTDATLNVVNGCNVVSPGCTNCYAMRSGGRNLPNHPSTGLTKPSNAGHVWTGEVRFNEKALLQPLRWKRPRKIFWNAHGDLFHENVPDQRIDRCFAVMALTPQHVHQVLTKRPKRMREYLTGGDLIQRWAAVENVEAVSSSSTAVESFRKSGAILHGGYPLPNVWLGVSVEDQKRANERIPILLDTPAAVRWLSCEPLLGAVDLECAWHSETALNAECWGDCGWCEAGYPPLHNCQRGRQEGGGWVEHPKGRSGLDWIVAGGESGPNARPTHPDWVRQIRDACASADVPFFFKQWGDWLAAEIYVEGERGGLIRFPHGPQESTFPGKPTHWWDDSASFTPGPISVRAGKKAAGRLLDGVQHDGYPA